MLRFFSHEGANFFAEPNDGEDGELQLITASGPSLYESKPKAPLER